MLSYQPIPPVMLFCHPICYFATQYALLPPNMLFCHPICSFATQYAILPPYTHYSALHLANHMILVEKVDRINELQKLLEDNMSSIEDNKRQTELIHRKQLDSLREEIGLRSNFCPSILSYTIVWDLTFVPLYRAIQLFEI